MAVDDKPPRKRRGNLTPVPENWVGLPPDPFAAEDEPVRHTEERKTTDADLDVGVTEAAQEVFDAPYEAYRLRVSGMDWTEIAKKTGYGSRNSCQVAVTVYLQRAAAEQSAQHMQEALQLAVGRYEAILAEWWQLGTVGHDEKAAAVLLRALSQLDRVQRLTEGDAIVTRETLVVSADPVEYVRQLQQAAAERGL